MFNEPESLIHKEALRLKELASTLLILNMNSDQCHTSSHTSSHTSGHAQNSHFLNDTRNSQNREEIEKVQLIKKRDRENQMESNSEQAPSKRSCLYETKKPSEIILKRDAVINLRCGENGECVFSLKF